MTVASVSGTASSRDDSTPQVCCTHASQAQAVGVRLNQGVALRSEDMRGCLQFASQGATVSLDPCERSQVPLHPKYPGVTDRRRLHGRRRTMTSFLQARRSWGSSRKSVARAIMSASISTRQLRLKLGSARCCSRHTMARECPGSMSAQNCSAGQGAA